MPFSSASSDADEWRTRDSVRQSAKATIDVFLAPKIPRHISEARTYLPGAALRFLQNEATRRERAAITTVVRHGTHAKTKVARRTVGSEVTNLDPRCPFVTGTQWTGVWAPPRYNVTSPSRRSANERCIAPQDGSPAVSHSASAEPLLQPRHRQLRHKERGETLAVKRRVPLASYIAESLD